MERVIALIDMDCFYCQVEEKLRPELKGTPVAVVQYDNYRGGGTLAVNYEARAQGVTRFMRGDDAKEKCPEITLVKVPVKRGKADIHKYREAGKDVARVLHRFTPLLERASVDEAYLDITQSVDEQFKERQQNPSLDLLLDTHVVGYDSVAEFIKEVAENELLDTDNLHRLLVAAAIVKEIRTAVYEETGYRCSAGISHNKIMAKLVCGMNKPDKQTLLPQSSIADLFKTLPVGKVRSLGGKFGENICKALKITYMSELLQFTEKQLQKAFDKKNGSRLYGIARGIDNDPVTPRFSSKSIGCCKKFPGKSAIVDLTTLMHWLRELGDEVEDRLKIDSDENNRQPTQMVASFTKFTDGKDVSCSRSINISKEEVVNGEFLARNALTLIRKDSKPFCVPKMVNIEGVESAKSVLSSRIIFLGISVGKFEETETRTEKSIQHFFSKASTSTVAEKADDVVPYDEDSNSSTGSAILVTTKSIRDQKSNLEKETAAKLSEAPPDSFIVKYLKRFQKPEEAPKNEDTTTADINDDSNSKDSDASIELEINKSKLLDGTENVDRDEIDELRKSFSVPVLKEDDSEVSCEECGKKIRESDIAVHRDYHVALSLRKESRIEKTERLVVKPTVKVKEKAKPPTKKCESMGADIVALFDKMKNPKACPSETETICEECGKSVEIVKYIEHTDYHEAIRLQREINRDLARSMVNNGEKNASKRKRSPTTGSSSSTKRIDSYFR